ncbi:MAG: glycosyltransferase family 39 protein [Acidobacteriia bacterium]|nr:glycosyltransferase family 39 protein [Terriglobia bacterium]
MSPPTIAPAHGASRTFVNGGPTPAPRATLGWIVLSGFALRVAVMLWTKVYTFPPVAPITDPDKQGWYFGYEIGRVARSIAEGHGFASPFHGNTGPTAWLAPLYPYLLAGVFRVFGVYSSASGIAILTFNSLCAALTAVPLYLLAERVLERRIALWSAWSWALIPTFYWTPVRWAWETSLSTLMVMLALLVTLRLPASDWRPWFAWGLLWGAIALTNPSLLSLAPFTLAWACWQRWQTERAFAAHAGLAVLVAIITIAPWLVRNHQTFGQWMFVRDNLGAELRFGNAEQARGIWMGWTDPPLNDSELARYRSMGELPYIAEKKREAIAFIRARPGFFFNLCLRRALLFWCGVPKDYSEDITPRDVLPQWSQVALASLAFAGLLELARRRSGAAWFFAPALVVYPVLYYVTFPDARYRFPIEPVMVMLAVYAIRQSLSAQARVT